MSRPSLKRSREIVTENGELAKSISLALHNVLKPAGFRKRANSFNRSVQDGLVHHVSVQLGSFDPSGKHAVPGLVPDLYGRYRVNLGVYVPEMNRTASPRSTWINDYNCQLRWGLGDFVPGNFDQWWDLRDRLSVEEVSRVLAADALPHLDQFDSAERVLAAWEEHGPRGFGPITPKAAALDVADLLIARNQRNDAERLLKSYVDEVSRADHAGHKEYLRKYLAERDFASLAETLQ
ncbi:DUF4304 domain-containing protein [Rathayibacter sp. KR2-224]|uniref:DUF4304 domain-containing protein n=1 Tax=Rathayibacter sp. KR2-224 TaxID=3400913 RepID=UPI003C0EAE6A